MELSKEQMEVVIAVLTERVKQLELDNAYYQVVNDGLKEKLGKLEAEKGE